MANYPQAPAPRIMFSVSQAFTATSATVVPAVPFGCRMVRLEATTTCTVRISNPEVAAALGSGVFLRASTGPFYFRVMDGDVITVIRNSVDGTLTVTFMENV